MSRDVDNRNSDEMIAYLEDRVKALQRQLELSKEMNQRQASLIQELTDTCREQERAIWQLKEDLAKRENWTAL